MQSTLCMRTTTSSALALSIALLATVPVSMLAATPEHAPAIVEAGVFGLVTECEPDRAPSIVPALRRPQLHRAQHARLAVRFLPDTGLRPRHTAGHGTFISSRMRGDENQ